MNSFGRIFRVSILGESHGECVGVIIDGCPPGLPLVVEDFEADLSRRRSGAKGTTPRKELDIPKLKSGVFNGHTTGAPLLIFFENKNIKSKDYDSIKDVPRPGHADFVAQKKYGGFNDYRGGGHFSGRLTLGLVAAGVVAKKIIAPMEMHARIVEIGGDTNTEKTIQRALENNDSAGGTIECTVCSVPVGLGEPFFDSAESLLSHIIFSIPGIKGIEFGAGFSAAKMTGSEYNDVFVDVDGTTKTNNAGGINGGITNGNNLMFRVAVKPTSTIGKQQKTINLKTGEVVDLQVDGRHDACFVLRVPVVVEAATAIVLADLERLEPSAE